MIGLEKLAAWFPGDADILKGLVEEHLERTGSGRARELLSAWGTSLTQFTKVMPRDLKAVLEKRRLQAEEAPKQFPMNKAAAYPLVKDLEDLVTAAVLKPKRKKQQEVQVLNSDGSTDTGSEGPRSPAEDSDTQVKIRDTRVERADKNRGFIAYERAGVKYREA